jgi:hypothetical protein
MRRKRYVKKKSQNKEIERDDKQEIKKWRTRKKETNQSCTATHRDKNI